MEPCLVQFGSQELIHPKLTRKKKLGSAADDTGAWMDKEHTCNPALH